MGKIKKYEYIDSLRGIAILLVICVHTWMASLSTIEYLPTYLDLFLQAGRYGVQLFFMVSAYTLLLSYHNRRDEKNATLNFFLRRVFRIFPMYYIAIILYTFVLFTGFNLYHLDLSAVPVKGLVTNALMLQSCFPAWTNGYVPGGWTISVEFLFYLSLPGLCIYVNSLKKSLLFLLLTLIISYLANQYITGSKFNVYDFAYFNPFNHFPAFALGFIAYWAVYDKTIKENLAVCFLIVSGIVGISIFVYTPSYLIILLALLFLMMALIYKPYKLFSNKFLAQIGKQSFSIYLVHFAVIILIQYIIGRGSTLIAVNDTITACLNILLYFLLILVGAFIVSYFTYYYIEEKGVALGKRLINYINNK